MRSDEGRDDGAAVNKDSQQLPKEKPASRMTLPCRARLGMMRHDIVPNGLCEEALMQRARTHRLLLMAYLLTAATFIAPSRSTAQPASRFDGAWSVNLSCESADDGAFGYTWQFTALVVNGILHGEHGQRSGPGWMTLDGTIQPDGSALLVADGLTGDPRYNVGRARPLRPFHYRVSAQFNPPKGTGSRLEVRPCTLAFTKT